MDKQKLMKAVVAICLAIPLLSLILCAIEPFLSTNSIVYKIIGDIDVFDHVLFLVNTIAVSILVFLFFYPRILKK